MKKWLRRALVAAALIGVTLGILYEVSTHTMRGWWNGEATFQDRPTSYWRSRIESWVERFDSPDDAEKCLIAHSFNGMISSTAIIYTPPRPTFWGQVRGWLGKSEFGDSDPPEILRSFTQTEAEPVLRELEDEPTLKRIVEIARHNKFIW
jgi:hypothetical protein